MNRLAAIPSSNGVIKIARKGKTKFQLGEGPDAPQAEVDVVATLNEFREQADAFYEGDDIPKERRREYNAMTDEFVARVFETTDLTHAEALEFISLLVKEEEKLKCFFDGSSPGGPSSPENTEPSS